MFEILDYLRRYFNVEERKIKFNVFVTFYFLVPRKGKRAIEAHRNIFVANATEAVTKSTCLNSPV